jgi:hypothetical protein
MKRVATSRLIRSSYFWVLFLPVVVGLLPKGKEEWLQRLPFGWHLWFFAACAFVISLVAYSSWCPRLVRDYNRFDEFQSDGGVSSRLLRALDYVVEASHVQHAGTIASHFRRKFTAAPAGAERGAGALSEADEAVIPVELQSEAFWFIHDLSDCCSPLARLLCFAGYCVGFFFTTIIVLQNLYAVLKMAF